MLKGKDIDVEAVKTCINRLSAITNLIRLKIVQYCLTPRKFSEIIYELRLNPASFKFHTEVLMDSDLIRRTERGVYEATDLGRRILEFLNLFSVEVKV